MRGLKILVADDDPAIRLVLRHRLEAAGCRVEEASDGAQALSRLRRRKFDAALIDIIMPELDGLEVLSRLRAEQISTAIVIVTAASTMSNAIEAMKRGAHDYLTKPFANLDLVVGAIARAATVIAHDGEDAAADGPQLSDGEIVGRSPAMQEVYKLIGRIVNNSAAILIQGESGTGKELVARAIHFKSDRRGAPFIALNCSAIPANLLESELFGYERGAFTGAAERRAGKFEIAGAGTIFLDEIGDLPLELQPKLLRTLQEREYTRIGGAEPLRLAARVIAASNQDLEKAVAGRRFREDLYFRLRVVPINLPPLRERREDIPELTACFLAKAARDGARGMKTLSEEARVMLATYSWPGNVRELENCVLRAALLSPGNVIRAEDLGFTPPAETRSAPIEAPLDELIARQIHVYVDRLADAELCDLYRAMLPKFEKPLIEAVLCRTGGNQLLAARYLGLNRNTLRRKIDDLNIAARKTNKLRSLK
ncbi:MAG: sigma-54-dependent transcriptional regulator [Candidatus Binataceae bacterium]